jgi:magnesium-transporting ATPase (P-type)
MKTDGYEAEIEDEWMQDFKNSVVSHQMAKESLKGLCYGIRKMTYEDYVGYVQGYDTESDEFYEALCVNFTYLGTFGLDDPLRDNVSETVQLIRYGMLLPSHSHHKRKHEMEGGEDYAPVAGEEEQP